MSRAAARTRRLLVLAIAVVLLAAGGHRLAPRAEPAAAVVGHHLGYRATVDRFTSWYGSYDMGHLGPAWCVDHGIRAPDPDLGYVPTTLEAPADLQVALAWALGRHGVDPDGPTAAALMLVAHDLLGATYPSGDLDVDTMGPDRLAGFGDDADLVLGRAQAIKAEALTHGSLRLPWRLELVADDPLPGQPGSLVARVTANGIPVAGIELRAVAAVASFDGDAATALVTGADGTATAWFLGEEGAYRFEVSATVPDLQLQAFAPTRARAQRVARPLTVPLLATLDRVGVAPPTTTTTSTTVPETTTTSSTTSTTTTSTSTTTTSTTVPETSTSTTTSTTLPSTTLPSTTLPSTTLPSTTEPMPATTSVTVLGTVTPRALPRTGADPMAWGCVGSGLVLLGASIRPRRSKAGRSDNPRGHP